MESVPWLRGEHQPWILFPRRWCELTFHQPDPVPGSWEANSKLGEDACLDKQKESSKNHPQCLCFFPWN